MDCKIVWTDPAIEDLRAIVAYISANDPAAAHKVGSDLLETVDLLARFPLIGPPYLADRSGRIREVVCWSYRIFYRVSADRKIVEILTVWHGSRDEPRLDFYF